MHAIVTSKLNIVLVNETTPTTAALVGRVIIRAVQYNGNVARVNKKFDAETYVTTWSFDVNFFNEGDHVAYEHAIRDLIDSNSFPYSLEVGEIG